MATETVDDRVTISRRTALALVQLVSDHTDQLTALAIVVEERLKEVHEEANLTTAWRMSELLVDLCGTTKLEGSVRAFLGLEGAAA